MLKHVLISRTDAIGDVVLTLPICGIIKAHYPSCKVSFLGNNYTADVVTSNAYVDAFISINSWDEMDERTVVEMLKKLNIDAIIHVLPNPKIARLAKKADIAIRIGTRNRIFHWITCNKLVKLSRRNSKLHEAQLNIKLLAAVGIDTAYQLEELPEFYDFLDIAPLSNEQKSLLQADKFNLLIHPKSSGSAMEWSLANYEKLINILDPEKFEIFITGSAKEQVLLAEWIKNMNNRVIDLTGKFTLKEFLAFIKLGDGLVASSTGPLHLAAVSGIHALGLYTNSKSVNAGRWAPIGRKAGFIEASNENINSISPEQVSSRIAKWADEK